MRVPDSSANADGAWELQVPAGSFRWPRHNHSVQSTKPQEEINFWVLRIQRKHFSQVRNRIIKFQFGLFQNTQSFENFRISGSNRQRLMISIGCAGVISGFFRTPRLLEERVGITLSHGDAQECDANNEG